MHVLRLMAIANELKNESLYKWGSKLDLKQYKTVANAHSLLIKSMARQIRKDFYQKLGIAVDESNEANIDVIYMVDIMYASENLKDNDRVILILLLKAAIYQLDLKQLFTTELAPDLQENFSHTEWLLLCKFGIHNKKVQLKFENRNVDWDLWQNGIEAIEGVNVNVALWQRNVSHDLFQGEFCNSCISMVKGNARANLYYLTDFNFSMLEIIEKKQNQTIGHVTIWVAETRDSKLILVLNSIQIHRRYEEYGAEIRNLIFEYADKFSQQLGIQMVILGQGYNAVPLQVLREIDDVCQEEESNNSFLIQSTDSSKQKQDIVQIEDLQIQIICPAFLDEMYSDIYFNGWVDTKDMLEEDASIWDITLFLRQAENIRLEQFGAISPDFSKKYEIWIVVNPEFKSIKVCNHTFNNDGVIFISNTYLEQHQENIIAEIKQKIIDSETLTKHTIKRIEPKAEEDEDFEVIFVGSDEEQIESINSHTENERRSWHTQSWFTGPNAFFNTDKPWYTRSWFCIEEEISEKYKETEVRNKIR